MNDYYSSAERAFRESGPMYHLYTFPLETESFYQDSKDRVTVLNLLAICIMDSDCKLLAFSLMSNHFHFIIAGEQARILAFFERFKRLLQNYYRYHGRKVNLGKMTAGLTLIESLRQFQNELAYVIRNSFVVNSEVNVFADLWSSGYLYFNPFLSQDRKRLAVLLKNNYYASNGQLSRLTGLPLSEVNQLFPLTAKTQIK